MFKHRSLSYVDVLDYNSLLFEDFEIISSFIQSTPGKLGLVLEAMDKKIEIKGSVE